MPISALTELLGTVIRPAPDIEVWLVRLDIPEYRTEKCATLLSPDEQVRAQRFHFERDRRRYTVARGMLRLLLGNTIGRAPQAVQFQYGQHGKPFLAAEPAQLYFNVSHSADMAIYAISRERTLGVDIESLNREIDAGAISQRFFTTGERAALQRISSADRKRALLVAWTRKEAILKSTGDGLRLPLDQIEVTVAPDAQPELLNITHGQITNWRLYTVDAGRGFVATVAAHRAGCVAASAITHQR